MTFPDLITTTTISRFRIPSYHALALALIFILILLYMVVSFPTLSRCVLSKFPRKFKSDIDSCSCTITSTSNAITYISLLTISLLLQKACANQTPILALATSTSFSHSSGVLRRRERACRPILSNSSFKRLLTIRCRWIAVLEAKAGETIATAKSGNQLPSPLLHPDNTISRLGLSQYRVVLYGIHTRESSPGGEPTYEFLLHHPQLLSWRYGEHVWNYHLIYESKSV
jgi:hypothetical protein